MKKKIAGLLLALLTLIPALGAELSPAAQGEIAYLLSHMEQSGCDFNRNGSWYNATDASAHVRKKYQYLVRNELLTSAEDFIVGAASQSSISKLPYQVRCPGQPVLESGPWFNSTLQQHRQRQRKISR